MPRQLQATRPRELADDAAQPAAHAMLGRIVALTDAGGLLLAVPGCRRPVPGRLAIPLTVERLRHAAETRQPVVLVFEGGDLRQPIVVGLIEDPRDAPAAEDGRPAAAPLVIEADADGRRVRLTAQDEIVLECGEACITLRRNGRVLIRGAYVETAACGTNRIKGAQVRVN